MITMEWWKLECEWLRGEGVRPKDFPAKPKRPPKPKVVIEGPDMLLEENDEPSESSGSEDE